jgi:transposase-like protein
MNHAVNDPTGLCKRCHFDGTVIILCIRWYITYKLSSRDVVAIMAERNADVVYTTIMRWVQRSVPGCETCWHRYTHPVGASWRVDETYLKVKGKRIYLYHAVDRAGQTVDFLLSQHRDIAAAKRFFRQAVEKRGVPEKVTLDGYTASHEAVAQFQEEDILPVQLIVRTNRFLNTVIEQEDLSQTLDVGERNIHLLLLTQQKCRTVPLAFETLPQCSPVAPCEGRA